MRGCLAATRVHCLPRHNVAVVVVVVAVCAILFVCYLRVSLPSLTESQSTFNYTFSDETTSHIAEVIQKPQERPATISTTTTTAAGATLTTATKTRTVNEPRKAEKVPQTFVTWPQREREKRQVREKREGERNKEV